MSNVKCLVVKSCNGYVSGLYGIIEGIKGFWNWIWNGRLSKEDFIVDTFITSIFAAGTLICLTQTLSIKLPGFFLKFTLIVGVLPIVLIPIYGAVYDCLVDERLKVVDE